MIRQSPGFDESPAHRCNLPRIRKKKLVFTSPRFSKRDEDIFVRNENLFDSSKRWGCISDQAGDHQQSGKILVLHRTIDPMSLLYGMTRQASLRVRSLSLFLDQRECDFEKWVDIISATLINLENLSIVDSQFKDLATTTIQQRLHILQKIPNLKSIDGIEITSEERYISLNRRRTGSQVVDCDVEDETASLDSPSRRSLEVIDCDYGSMECGNVENQKNELRQASPIHPHSLSQEKSKFRRSEYEELLRTGIDEQMKCLNILPDASSALEPTYDKCNAHCSMGEATCKCRKDNLDIESVTSSHLEWTAACGVLAFRSDNVCVPGIRLPFCGTTTTICDDDNQRLRVQAKKRLLRKNNNSSASMCSPVQRRASSGSWLANQAFADCSLAETTFFASNDETIETKTKHVLNEQNINAPVEYQMDFAKIVGRSEVVPHGGVQQWRVSKENQSMFDKIYDENDDDDDEVSLDH